MGECGGEPAPGEIVLSARGRPDSTGYSISAKKSVSVRSGD